MVLQPYPLPPQTSSLFLYNTHPCAFTSLPTSIAYPPQRQSLELTIAAHQRAQRPEPRLYWSRQNACLEADSGAGQTQGQVPDLPCHLGHATSFLEPQFSHL